MWQSISQWLWSNRKALIIAFAVAILLESLFNQPGFLYWWLAGTLVMLVLGGWWATNLPIKSPRLWILIAQLLWVAAAVVGFVIFNVVNMVEFQAIAVITAGVVFWLLTMFESFAATGTWPVRALPILDFVDLVAFFFAGAAMMMASDFYSFSVAWLLAGFTVQAVLALSLRFWREDLHGIRKWLYTIVVALVAEEVVWVASFWHRGVFLKTFFVSVVFYLMADFIVHYTRGRLTVKVALEYLGLVVAVLVGVLIVDGFLVLR